MSHSKKDAKARARTNMRWGIRAAARAAFEACGLAPAAVAATAALEA